MRNILRGHDIRALSERPRRGIEQLVQNLADARVAATDFELSETDEDRASNAKLTVKWLTAAQRRVMTASQSDLFGPVDVAHLSAQMEQVITRMR